MRVDGEEMKKKEGEKRLQSCSGEERNQNGVSEGMCKLGQTLLRLLLLLPSPLLPPPPLLLLLFLSLLAEQGINAKERRVGEEKLPIVVVFSPDSSPAVPPSPSLSCQCVSVSLSH